MLLPTFEPAAGARRTCQAFYAPKQRIWSPPRDPEPLPLRSICRASKSRPQDCTDTVASLSEMPWMSWSLSLVATASQLETGCLQEQLRAKIDKEANSCPVGVPSGSIRQHPFHQLRGRSGHFRGITLGRTKPMVALKACIWVGMAHNLAKMTRVSHGFIMV